MRDGSVIHQGTFDEIIERDASLFADWSIAKDYTSDTASGVTSGVTSASEYDDGEEEKTRREQRRQKTILGGARKNTGEYCFSFLFFFFFFCYGVCGWGGGKGECVRSPLPRWSRMNIWAPDVMPGLVNDLSTPPDRHRDTTCTLDFKAKQVTPSFHRFFFHTPTHPPFSIL